MQDYIIGIDMGVNNVGWSVVEENEIKKAGVRLFNSSDNAEKRREFRNVRRRIKRKKTRIKDVLFLFKQIGFPSENLIDENLLDKRVNGLSNKLDKQDITNIFCYYVSHRGYIPFGDEERELIDLNGLFPCEYYKELLNTRGKYRALEEVIDHNDLVREMEAILDKQTNYYPELKTVYSKLLEILSRKRKFWEGPGSIKSFTPYGRFKNEDDVKKYIEIKKQGGEKYLYDDLIGKCSIYPNEKSTTNFNYYYEKFNFLQDFINCSITDISLVLDQNLVEPSDITGLYRLSSLGLEKCVEYTSKNIESKLSYKKIYKDVIGISEKNLSGYRIDKKGKPEFSTFNTYRKIRTTLNKNNFDYKWTENIEEYNEFIRICALCPGFVEAKKMLNASKIFTYGFNDEELEVIKQLFVSIKKDIKYGSFGEKILKRAINDMITENKNYMKCSRIFNYEKEKKQLFVDNYKETEGLLLISDQFVDELIASPQVKKSLKQSIKVINAIIEEKGYYPKVIAVESTKEMNGEKIRNKIINEQKIYEKRRKEAKELIISNFGEDFASQKNIQKTILFDEINGICPYCGKPLKDGLNGIIKSSLEIEHILPLSQSSDDSFDNKTLSCRECNSSKGNKSPYLWLGEERFKEFSDRISKLKISDNKRNNFLETRDIDKYKQRFINRNLRDTAYATKELINQINIFNDFLKEKVEGDLKIKTLSTPGQLTHDIRESLNVKKDRDDGKYHHAVDATIVAMIANDDDLGSFMLDLQNNPKFWILNKNKVKYMDKKIKDFKNNENETILKVISTIKSDDDINISAQVQKDPNVQIANANIYKFIKKDDNWYIIEQINDLYDPMLLKNKKINDLFNKDDAKLCLMIKDNNTKLFNKLKEIFNDKKYNDGKSNPFVNYCTEVNGIEIKDFDSSIHGIKNGKGPIVRKLRYYHLVNDPLILNKKNIKSKDNTYIGMQGVAQYCTKVYWDLDKNKFIFMPIYVNCVNFKTKKINKNNQTYKLFYNKYLNDKNVEFIADLYNGNYIEVEKNIKKIIGGFFQYFDKTNNVVKLKSGDSFTKNDLSITIYDVDYLGHKIKRLTWPEK